ncbi:hypothetical protein [uncultured Shimia sp.]|uniref:hypothetical protein n=1 Tax=uncultured Shimia sp. TaxID=573152 RepID=UPI00260B3CEC|nr:hypothetical protein [uncultured Shimia sp.]
MDVLFPKLSDGGLYMIEDTHASYWANYSGGYQTRGSFMTVVKSMIDDIHHWYHNRGFNVLSTGENLRAVHVYDSIVVL